MTTCRICGSRAINPTLHRRDNSNLDICDVCFWRERSKLISPLLEILGKLDCGSNSCRFAQNKSGQRTNGGCSCLIGIKPILRITLEKLWCNQKGEINVMKKKCLTNDRKRSMLSIQSKRLNQINNKENL